MKKEKATRMITMVVPPSLYEEFEASCREEHRTVSEIIREFMSRYADGWRMIPINVITVGTVEKPATQEQIADAIKNPNNYPKFTHHTCQKVK